MKKFLATYLFTILIMLFFIALGTVFIIFRNKGLAMTYFTIIGIVIIIIGVFKLTLVDKDRLGRLEYNLDLAEGLINLIVGVVFINFFEYIFVDFVLFAMYITIPICRCFYSQHPVNQVFVDSPKFLMSFSIVFASNFTFKVFFSIMGGIFILVGVGIMIRKIIFEVKELKERKKEELHEEEQN